MMHGMMFPGMGMFGFIWLIIPVMAIFFGLKYLRKLRTTRPTPDFRARGQTIEYQILQLAKKKGGELTVTDVVLGTGMPMKKAEETLNAMVDSYRVNMQVRDSGIIVYEFTELKNKAEEQRPPELTD